MLHNKKVVDKTTVEKLEAEIGRLTQIIEQRKVASKGGTSGIKAALEIFKSYRSNCKNLLAECFFKTNHVKMMRSIGYANEIVALDFVISIFEDPDASTYVHRSQLTGLEKQLEELKKYPTRE